MDMIENWKNNKQTEQNNSKVPVDFTSQNDGAQGMLCHIVWIFFFLAYHTCLSHLTICLFLL